MNGDDIDMHDAALQVLLACDPVEKCRLTQELATVLQRACLNSPSASAVTNLVLIPGRPTQPQLVSPKQLPARSTGNQAGRTTLMHAIAHIEFNAINLAWDAAYRFRGMPEQYYRDWIKVAADEAYHFGLVCAYLAKHGCAYGDYPAHDGLWEMAIRTRHDVMVRMALVPRGLEARGLDVTPAMIQKFEAAGDQDGARILNIIYQDEIGHVEAGSRWFKYCCAQRGLDARLTFCALIAEFFKGELRGPYNRSARLQAGFDPEELQMLLGI